MQYITAVPGSVDDLAEERTASAGVGVGEGLCSSVEMAQERSLSFKTVSYINYEL